MATIKTDPRLQEQDQQKQLQEGTISGTSGASTQSTQQPQTAPQNGQQASPSQPTSPQPKVTQRASQASSAPRSGMATNVQSYIDKNRPAAQGIAQAVTKDISQQTGNITQQAQQQQGRLQSQLAANQSTIDQAKNYAQQQIQNIMQGSAQQQQAPQVAEEDANRFQQLMRGDIGVSKVQDLNLAPQQQRLQALQGLAGGVGTEQGRRSLLAQTFGGDREYTRGQSALDQLILGGDQAASQALQQGATGAYESAQDALRQMGLQSRADVAAQQAQIAGFGEDISGLLSGAESSIQDPIQAQYEQALAERAAILDPESEAYQQAITGASEQQSALQATLGGGEKGFASYLMDQLISGNLQSSYGQSDWNMNQVNLLPYLAEQAGRLDDIGFSERKEETGMFLPSYLGGGKEYKSTYSYIDPFTGQSRQTPYGTGLDLSHHKERMYMRGLADDLQKQLGLGTESADLYGAGSIDSSVAEKGVSSLFEALQKQYGNISNKTPEQILQDRLTKGTGYSYEDLVQGRDIGQYELADPEQIQRLNALKRLSGQSDIIDAPEVDYSEASSLQDLLKRFGS